MSKMKYTRKYIYSIPIEIMTISEVDCRIKYIREDIKNAKPLEKKRLQKELQEYSNKLGELRKTTISNIKEKENMSTDSTSNNEPKKYKVTGISDISFHSLNNSFSSFSLGNTNDFSFSWSSPKKEETIKEDSKKILKPREIMEHLNQHVIGQEEAKMALSVAVYNHYKRINYKCDEDGIELQKSNILMIGNSGCGKTLLAQTIAKILDVPFLSVDATSYTPTGIVGKNVEDIIKDLVSVAGGDKKKAERGIIYIDEFDKLSGCNSSKVASNVKGVLGGDTQASFLKLIEGSSIDTDTNTNWLSGSSNVKLNTKNILFICGGAFAGIENLIEKKDFNSKPIGFSSYYNSINNVEEIDVWDKIGSEQVIKYGMMPEIVGRLPVILKLRPLEKNDLVKILTEPKNSIIKQYKKMLSIDGVILDFTQDALETIAEMAILMKTGARGLRSIVENVTTKIIFNLPEDEYERKCVVTGECIKNNIMPNLTKTINEYGLMLAN